MNNSGHIFANLLPPQNREFGTFNEAFTYLDVHAERHGYALSKSSSHAGKYFTIGCTSRHDSESRIEPALRQRKRLSAGTECPFRLTVTLGKRNIVKVKVKNGSHNHLAFTRKRDHVKNRKLTVDESTTIHRQVANETNMNLATTPNMHDPNAFSALATNLTNARPSAEAVASIIEPPIVQRGGRVIERRTASGFERAESEAGTPGLQASQHRMQRQARAQNKPAAVTRRRVIKTTPFVLPDTTIEGLRRAG